MKLSDLKKLSEGFSGPVSNDQAEAMYSRLKEMGYDPGKLYQELEMSSRYVDTHRDISFSETPVSLHSHAFYELLYCRSTGGVEYLVGSERYRLSRGDVVIVPPGISHRPLFPARMYEPYRRDVVWISTEFVELMRQIIGEMDTYLISDILLLRTVGEQSEKLGALFDRGIRESERRVPGWELAILGSTIELTVQIQRAMREGGAKPMAAEEPELLDQVMAYVERHLSDKITLTDIARRFYVSESTITQTFRKKMGDSFYHCVTQRRLIAAKNLIWEGVGLENVGQRVGFRDYSSFYRAFKQEYGISPRQYKTLQSVSV